MQLASTDDIVRAIQLSLLQCVSQFLRADDPDRYASIAASCRMMRGAGSSER